MLSSAGKIRKEPWVTGNGQWAIGKVGKHQVGKDEDEDERRRKSAAATSGAIRRSGFRLQMRAWVRSRWQEPCMMAWRLWVVGMACV